MARLAKINIRVLMLAAAVLAPLAWYGYVLADQLRFHGVKPHDGYTEVDLRTLGAFDFNPETDDILHVPARFRALDGKRVVLTGVMYSPDAASDRIDHFQFVYNIMRCCIVGPPQVQERVFARCAPGKPVDYYHDNEPVRLTGILHVKIEHDRKDGVVTAVYELDVESADLL